MWKAALLAGGLTLAPIGAMAQSAGNGTGCGSEVEVQPGDTLSTIASRCDVTEGLILRANPRIDGSADLRVGQTVSLTGPMDRLKSFASEAGRQLGDTASEVGSSVRSSIEGFLADNPDISDNIRNLGQSITDLTTGDGNAEVSLQPQSGEPGSTVTVTASGLPADQPAVIAGGTPGTAFSVLEETRTGQDGTLRAAIIIPDDLPQDAGSYQISVRAEDGSWKAAAPRFSFSTP